jgi:LPS-assembly protein
MPGILGIMESMAGDAFPNHLSEGHLSRSAGRGDGSPVSICNFATLRRLIAGKGVLTPISSSIRLLFAGMFIPNASGNAREAAAGGCSFRTVLRVMTAGWGGRGGRRGFYVMVGEFDARLPVSGRCASRAAAPLLVFSAAILFSLADCGQTLAQLIGQVPYLTFQNQIRPKPDGKSIATKPAPDAQMLVQANEIRYDYNNLQVSAVGNVQIYYNGATIEADKVVYDQRSKRLHAEGNARLTEADGKVSYGELLDLSDDYRDGFIDSLRLETPDETRMAATRADRTGGNYTVFQSGVYTACEPCRDDPKKPPLWQVRAARIIHNESEKMMYFEDAKIDFFGVPLAWVPFMSAPDPTVKRKTGFLMPIITTSSGYGVGIETPYYLDLAPNYDATISPRITSSQGPLIRGEFRERFDDGELILRGAAIDQLDKNKFIIDGVQTPGFTNFRGAAEASGRFNLSPQWTWGFDGVLLSDQTFFQDYKIVPLQNKEIDPILNYQTEAISQLYLTGRGDRSYFDIRTIHYYGLAWASAPGAPADVQGTLPNVAPVIDYANTFDQPVLGGELSTKMNFTNINRETASFDAISATAANLGLCNVNSADPAQKIPANCLLRGVPGDYARLSAEVDWRYRYIDPYGQVFIPFASVRGDAAALAIDNQPGVSNYINTGDSTVSRAMPTVGLEYHYPFIGVSSWGTQTVEPIAQLIVRPNETAIGKLPNEDSQSLVFDDTNLFKVDKFSGWDRVEGGGRANVGVEYTAQFNHAGNLNMLFGQSYQLFGLNSFAVPDATNTGLGSGLDTTRSDYVARVQYQPNQIFSFTSRFRFDHDDFALQRLELEARANFDRWNVSVLYGDYAAQPQLGFLTRRDGVLTTGAYKLGENWVLNGGIRYDIQNGKPAQTRLGFGYIDDCFIMSFQYYADYTAAGAGSFGALSSSQTYMLQVSLRTIGGTGMQ